MSLEQVIRDGVRTNIKKNPTEKPKKDGYVRDDDSPTGYRRMSLKEQRNRSIAAKKSSNDAATKKKKADSDRKRKVLIGD